MKRIVAAIRNERERPTEEENREKEENFNEIESGKKKTTDDKEETTKKNTISRGLAARIMTSPHLYPVTRVRDEEHESAKVRTIQGRERYGRGGRK